MQAYENATMIANRRLHFTPIVGSVYHGRLIERVKS